MNISCPKGGVILMKALNKLQNESQTDRIVRFLAGLVVAFAAYSYFTGLLQLVLYIVAVILLVTAITGFCLIYKLVGISTLKK